MRAVLKALPATIALAVTSFIPAPIAAQQAAAVMSSRVGLIGGGLASVKGKPWSGTETTEHVQTLADGTHITQPVQKTTFYRDSEGRTRTERVMTPPPRMRTVQPVTLIDIEDPVAGYRYNFNSNETVVRRMSWPPQPPNLPPGLPTPAARTVIQAQVGTHTGPQVVVNGVSPAAEPGPRPEISHESLGAQTIEGVIATGNRTTTVYPVGFFGNDRPITEIRETWMSEELGRAVLTKTSDPRIGETTMKLTNVSLAEPDPSLFQPPADHEIRDINGPVTVY